MLKPEVRLLTLTGPPGTGKTRLASRVALDLAGEFKNGAHFIDLSPIFDPNLVLSAIGQVVGARPSLDGLVAALRTKQALLLLDNFEQVLAAAGQMAELLGACPELKVLVTSRECLHLLRWEHEYPVQPLQLPDLDGLPPLEVLLSVPAVALFVERARARDPRLALSQETAPTVARICVHLDGLPLAIELAAAGLKAFPLEAIFSRLVERQELVSQAGADVPKRHHSVSAAIDASYDFLSIEEQSLFRRLGVFVGGFDLESLESVCSGDGVRADQAMGVLAQLIDKSLVQREADGRRYRLLETIREYALERLNASGEAEAVNSRHTRYFVQLGEQAWGARRTRRESDMFDRLQLEIDNIRATLARALADGDLETGFRLGAAVSTFWMRRGFTGEGRGLLETFVNLADETGEIERFPVALRELAWLSTPWVDHPAARAQMERYLRMARHAGDHQGAAIALRELGNAYFDVMDFVAMRPLLEEGLQEARLSEDKSLVTDFLMFLGQLAHCEHDETTARQLTDESLAIAREDGDATGIRQAQWLRGQIEFDQAAYKAASECWVESLRGSRRPNSHVLEGFARLAIINNAPAIALRLAGAVEAVRELAQTTPFPYFHKDFDQLMDAIAGGNARRHPEWVAGRGMPAEEAMNLAFMLAARF
jgi:predicted ATPase